MTYAAERIADRIVYDADSHVMEGLDWLRDHADPMTRARLPDLSKALGSAGANAGTVMQRGQERIADPQRTAELAQDVMTSAKGWEAIGAMDPNERTQALDLLGFERQLVFSTFSLALFAFNEDPDVVYGGTTAHNRMMTQFCESDPRLIPVGFLPLDDPERSRVALDEALKMGVGAFWMATRPSGGRSPAHLDHDPIWAAVEGAGVPLVLHIGGGKSAISNAWHRNGRPKPKDLHGGGENLRAKDLPSVHHSAETWISAMVLDGVFERFPRLRCAAVELGASWMGSLMERLDYAAKSFKREPLIGELSMRPSDYIRRQVKATPFPGEDVGSMISRHGAELYLFSSDYPHPEGTRDPIGRFERSLDEGGISAEDRERFYATNFRELFGI